MNDRRRFLKTAALDAHGKLAGACTTSGMAWKLCGRVGDSPIIDTGMHVDGKVGGYAIQHGFSYAACDAPSQSALIPSASVFNT